MPFSFFRSSQDVAKANADAKNIPASPSEPRLFATETYSSSPDELEVNLIEVERTSSGNSLLLLFRHRSNQEKVSRERALTLCSLYELSDDKDEKLNKKLQLKADLVAAPKFCASMSAEQAAAIYRKRKEAAKRSALRNDPLLTERERQEKSNERNTGSQCPSTLQSSHGTVEHDDTYLSFKMRDGFLKKLDSDLSETFGIETVLTPDSVSLVSTDSSSAESTFTFTNISDGQVFESPNKLC